MVPVGVRDHDVRDLRAGPPELFDGGEDRALAPRDAGVDDRDGRAGQDRRAAVDLGEVMDGFTHLLQRGTHRTD
jgi:hypothetical protein